MVCHHTFLPLMFKSCPHWIIQELLAKHDFHDAVCNYSKSYPTCHEIEHAITANATSNNTIPTKPRARIRRQPLSLDCFGGCTDCIWYVPCRPTSRFSGRRASRPETNSETEHSPDLERRWRRHGAPVRWKSLLGARYYSCTTKPREFYSPIGVAEGIGGISVGGKSELRSPMRSYSTWRSSLLLSKMVRLSPFRSKRYVCEQS